MKKVLRSIYHAIPLKRQIFSMIKAVKTPPESIYKHLHFNGDFKVAIDKNHHFRINSNGAQIANEVFWEGLYDSWEGKSIEIWREVSLHSDMMFDIGANAGFYTLVSKTMNPSMKVHAFEPSNDWYKRFNDNCALNNIAVNSHKIALSNQDAETYIKSVWRDDNKTYTAQRLDTWIEENNIQKMDLLKIDVEHYVVEMVQGFETYFDKFRPNVMIEILRDEYAIEIEKVWKTKEKGYLYFNINDKTKEVRQMSTLQERSDDMNIFICHPEMASKLKLI